jgi:hypothetical protein
VLEYASRNRVRAHDLEFIASVEDVVGCHGSVDDKVRYDPETWGAAMALHWGLRPGRGRPQAVIVCMTSAPPRHPAAVRIGLMRVGSAWKSLEGLCSATPGADLGISPVLLTADQLVDHAPIRYVLRPNERSCASDA